MIRKFSLLIIFLFIIILPKIAISTNILVIDIEELIDTNDSYIKFLNELEISQKKYYNILNKKELKLSQMKKEIEESKILLSENEFNKMIDDYNDKVSKFSSTVEEFNLHYKQQILNIRKSILEEIIVLLEKYAKNNKVDLIIDSTSYLIASNALNITNIIKNKLDDINLELDFENFKEN